VELGAKKAGTAAEVVGRCDIVFSCLADPQSVKDVIFSAGGVLEKITASKGYVEMTGIDSTTSEDVAEAIGLKGGRYLEAQVNGGRSKAADGSLVVLAAGDRGLYEDCSSCFKAVSKSTFYLGKVGNASNMNLVLNSVSGVLLAGLTEGMALGESAGLKPDTFLEVLNQTGLNCSFVTDSVKAVIDGSPPSQQRLGHLQKDLHLTVGLSHHLEVPMPVTAAANEAFKRARKR
jgi:3-hydroxyisobutyrate dehydrogenase